MVAYNRVDLFLEARRGAELRRAHRGRHKMSLTKKPKNSRMRIRCIIPLPKRKKMPTGRTNTAQVGLT